jgi:ubiquinone/menaquinone biosynthesis C-methylase UbiE
MVRKSPAVLDPASYAQSVAYQQWHFLLGLRGLAILRTGLNATDEQLASHVAALCEPPDPGDARLAKVIGGTERDVGAGYERWAPQYDAPGNPLIALEEPAAHEILASWPAPLRVLDAACGTGRHTVHLADLGHDVTGVDASPSMLGRAAAKNPQLTLVEGRIDAMPFSADGFDAAICALLFDHLSRIDHAIGELARVVRPGGRLLISNIHPTMALTGAHASFRDVNGDPNFMRSYHHSVAEYMAAFRAHSLTVVDCREPSWSLDHARAQFAFVPDAVLEEAVVGLPMALVWELAT